MPGFFIGAGHFSINGVANVFSTVCLLTMLLVRNTLNVSSSSWSGSIDSVFVYAELKTRNCMQMVSVCGEPNGNRRSHAEAWTVSSVTSQNSVCGYHLSTISFGGVIVTFTVDFPLGFVRKLGISSFFLC